MKHIIQSQQFNRKEIETLLNLAEDIQNGDRKLYAETLKGKIIATLFYEPSTRTRLSFESASLRLGASVISTENAREFSSASKGETLEDTIRVIGGYADAIILRHFETGSARIASKVSPVPLINAGDGSGQHPTQALLDLYTIRREIGSVNNISIAFIGDLLYGRTVHSLVYLLSKFKIKKMYFIAPQEVAIKRDIIDYLKKKKISFEERQEVSSLLPKVGVVYQTRIQKERFGDRAEIYNSIQGKYILDASWLKKMKKKSVILHPLPRVGEISLDVDTDPRAGYFRQAENGLYVRMAILKKLFERD
ncbi:MAG: aspartate carbamoyltransferase [Candidatus Moranbacteria bacterium]|nr:aspartate carbamoyltransferase [Candidatus Moranbacteria bacterium]